MVSRLFQIVYILMEKEKVTAKELAEKLEVSVRTINRDIEKLSEATCYIYTNIAIYYCQCSRFTFRKD